MPVGGGAHKSLKVMRLMSMNCMILSGFLECANMQWHCVAAARYAGTMNVY
jgi:hypothetical protein